MKFIYFFKYLVYPRYIIWEVRVSQYILIGGHNITWYDIPVTPAYPFALRQESKNIKIYVFVVTIKTDKNQNSLWALDPQSLTPTPTRISPSIFNTQFFIGCTASNHCIVVAGSWIGVATILMKIMFFENIFTQNIVGTYEHFMYQQMYWLQLFNKPMVDDNRENLF